MANSMNMNMNYIVEYISGESSIPTLRVWKINEERHHKVLLWPLSASMAFLLSGDIKPFRATVHFSIEVTPKFESCVQVLDLDSEEVRSCYRNPEQVKFIFDMLRDQRMEENTTGDAYPEKEERFDPISSPSHYTEGRKYEPRLVISDWNLDYYLGNVVKYISRAGRKGSAIEDLKKAKQYLEWEIEMLDTLDL